MKISRTSVITEALPRAKDVVFGGTSQRRKIGETAKPLVVIRDHGGNLSLLEHQLGDENGVRITGAAPWQGAAVTAKPLQKRAAKRASVFWRCHDLKANVERSTPNVQLSIQKMIEH